MLSKSTAPGVERVPLEIIASVSTLDAAIRVVAVGAREVPASVLSDALLTGAGAPTAAIVRRFLESFSGLTTEASPQRISQTVSAFNALVEGAAPDYLASPPAEFAAVHQVLRQLVVRTNER